MNNPYPKEIRELVVRAFGDPSSILTKLDGGYTPGEVCGDIQKEKENLTDERKLYALAVMDWCKSERSNQN